SQLVPNFKSDEEAFVDNVIFDYIFEQFEIKKDETKIETFYKNLVFDYFDSMLEQKKELMERKNDTSASKHQNSGTQVVKNDAKVKRPGQHDNLSDLTNNARIAQPDKTSSTITITKLSNELFGTLSQKKPKQLQDGKSGQPDGKSGQTHGKSGRTDRKSSQPDGKSDQYDGKSGRTDRKSERKSGRTDRKSGQTGRKSSQPDGKSGRTDRKSSQTDGKSIEAYFPIEIFEAIKHLEEEFKDTTKYDIHNKEYYFDQILNHQINDETKKMELLLAWRNLKDEEYEESWETLSRIFAPSMINDYFKSKGEKIPDRVEHPK
ncbi:surface cell antigen sca2, partial [Brachionus plicatilis]